MANERKEAIRAFKQGQRSRRGAFSVRCAATGEVWVGSAPNLGSIRNSIWFSLRHGLYRNAAMRAAWDAHGEEAFEFAVLEELDEDISPLLVYDELKKKKLDWTARLKAAAV